MGGRRHFEDFAHTTIEAKDSSVADQLGVSNFSVQAPLLFLLSLSYSNSLYWNGWNFHRLSHSKKADTKVSRFTHSIASSPWDNQVQVPIICKLKLMYHIFPHPFPSCNMVQVELSLWHISGASEDSGWCEMAESLGKSTQTEFKVLNESLGRYASFLQRILECANAVCPITLVKRDRHHHGWSSSNHVEISTG